MFSFVTRHEKLRGPAAIRQLMCVCVYVCALVRVVSSLSAGHLHSHDLASGLVDHVVDGAIRPAADLPKVSQIFCGEVAVLLRGDL